MFLRPLLSKLNITSFSLESHWGVSWIKVIRYLAPILLASFFMQTNISDRLHTFNMLRVLNYLPANIIPFNQPNIFHMWPVLRSEKWFRLSKVHWVSQYTPILKVFRIDYKTLLVHEKYGDSIDLFFLQMYDFYCNSCNIFYLHWAE